MPYVFIDPLDYYTGKSVSFEEYRQLITNANEAYGAGTNHGEVLVTRSAVSATGISVSGSTPGPYTLVVPAGVTQMEVEGVGGGGSGGQGTAGGNGNAGTASSISGSTSGTLATFNGGAGGQSNNGSTPSAAAGGTASDRANAGGAATVCAHSVAADCRGGHTAGPYFAGGAIAASPYGAAADNLAGHGFGAGGGSQGNATYGVSGGGGGAAGRFVITVSPGETLTLTVGSGGAAVGGNSKAGAPGMIRLIW